VLRNRRAAAVTAAAVAVVLVAALIWWSATRGDGDPAAGASPSPAATTPTPTPTPTVGPSPAAPAVTPPADPGTGPAQPAQPGQPGTDPVAPAPGLATVDVATTYAGWNDASGAVEVGAYAAAVESGGTCTLTLTQGATTVTTQGTATPDASTTACGALAVGRDRLSAGAWQAVVSYASATSSGVAAPVSVEVP
jgi:hypothetical protein